ncbi:hypothetical protein L2E82_48896 [Cichorium intybus]|uniref:Uncharacterized protein n=1 Tax=Cichorium intybus TaxID=13427 RepID=A0ACB8YYU3_CICIN|nr:hypothetical protein L2E82_48896 [Cichorium intybus]
MTVADASSDTDMRRVTSCPTSTFHCHLNMITLTGLLPLLSSNTIADTIIDEQHHRAATGKPPSSYRKTTADEQHHRAATGKPPALLNSTA